MAATILACVRVIRGPRPAKGWLRRVRGARDPRPLRLGVTFRNGGVVVGTFVTGATAMCVDGDAAMTALEGRAGAGREAGASSPPRVARRGMW